MQKRKKKGVMSDREVAKFNELVNQEDFVISEPNLERFYKCRKIDSVSDLSQESAKQTESEPKGLIDKKEISKEPLDIESNPELTKVVKVREPKLSYPLISLMEIVNTCFTCLACPEMKFSKKFVFSFNCSN